MRPTVLIVDDHADFRRAASALLTHEGFDVLGVAANGALAIVKCARLEPSVVLLDVQLPDSDGFEVAEQLSALPHPPTVVLVSSRDAEAYGVRVATSQATAFITKAALTGPALEAILRGVR